MSMDPEAPDDFVTFSGSEAAPHAFLARALYARYVTARVAATVKTSAAKMRLWRDEAVGIYARRRRAPRRRDAAGGRGDPGDRDRSAREAGAAPLPPARGRRVGRVRARDAAAGQGRAAAAARLGPLARWTCSRSSTRRDSRARSPSSRRAGSCRCRTSPSSRGRRPCRPTTSRARRRRFARWCAGCARRSRRRWRAGCPGSARSTACARTSSASTGHCRARRSRQLRPPRSTLLGRVSPPRAGGRSGARRRLDARRPVATDRRPGDDRRAR